MTRKNLLFIILGLLLIAAITAGGYFYFLQPLAKELESKEAELKMADQQLTVLENKLANLTADTAQSTMRLQQRIPVKRSVEQLMLEIEKAETVSNVQIDSISMGGTGADKVIEAPQQESHQAQNEENNENDSQSTPTTVLDEEAEKQAIVLPSGIKQTPFTMSGEAKNYFELEKFLESLQGLKRKVTLDQLSFKGFNEKTNPAQSDERISFNLSISAFYFPKLEDLRNEIPPIDTPEISNKKNPFNELPTVSTNER